MLERLRMQEVSQIILSVPEGAVIAGTNLHEGEPVMIIEKPSTSQLNFATRGKTAEDGRGFISASGQTQSIDFTINEGSILYAVWSYLHGLNQENTDTILKGSEWLELNKKGNLIKLSTSTEPMNLILYKKNIDEGLSILIPEQDYDIVVSQGIYYIHFTKDTVGTYFTVYDYTIKNIQQTLIKQIHNNIFCSMDIYFNAVDMNNDDKHVVCVHCDKVQVFSDLAISINNSSKASFTPIVIKSIPEGDELNKNIATITVI